MLNNNSRELVTLMLNKLNNFPRRSQENSARLISKEFVYARLVVGLLIISCLDFGTEFFRRIFLEAKILLQIQFSLTKTKFIVCVIFFHEARNGLLLNTNYILYNFELTISQLPSLRNKTQIIFVKMLLVGNVFLGVSLCSKRPICSRNCSQE